MKKKGQLFDIFVILVVMFVTFLFFAGFLYGYNLLTAQVTSVQTDSSIVNITSAAQSTFGQINTGLQSLKWISLVIVISMIISIMVSNFLVRAHPVFFIVYVMITIAAVIFSVYISNAYESILTASNPLTAELQSFRGMDYIMLHLPIWTTIIGFIGAIFLFIGVVVDRDQGGSIPL